MNLPSPAETTATNAIASLPPLRYVLTRADLMRLITQDPSVRENFVFAELFVRGFGGPAIIALSAWLSTSAAMLGLRGLDSWLMALAIGLVLLLPFGLAYGVMWRWLANKYAAQGFTQPREIRFTADGFVYQEGLHESHIPWGAVRRVVELRDASVLHLSFRPDLAIPHRAFAQDWQRRQWLHGLRHDVGVPIETPEPRSSSNAAYFPWEHRARRTIWLASWGMLVVVVLMFLLIIWP